METQVGANMQKLIYYAATSPEKWDRIGDYLAYKIGRDLNRTYPRCVDTLPAGGT